MEQTEVEKSVPANSEESCQLNRNRSFKTKQLVRSQAIRESQSPPRTISPCVENNELNNYINNDNEEADNAKTTGDNVTSDVSSHASDDVCSVNSCEKNEYSTEFKKKQQVEIQITPGWESESHQKRTKRWSGQKQHSRDLLSNNPRVACVCGACTACVYCRDRRRKNVCPTKQDSGIVCSDDCPDCSDSEATSGSNNDGRKPDNSEDDQAFCRCPERKEKEKPKTISLSRTDSDEKTEPTGVELVNFIKETLNKNIRDRMTMLKIEKELHSLINDTSRCIVRFPVMTSYGRMLVHRCASLFELSHHLDHTNKNAVLVSKSGTSGGRIPCTSFRQWCTANLSPAAPRQDHHTKSILKRDAHSLDEGGAGAMNPTRSKSLEQREKEYERVRRRIFSTDNCNQDDPQWPWINSGPVKLLTPDAGRNKLLKVQSLEGSTGQQWVNRGAVSKSHSFGGYGGAVEAKRTLSRQGDLASSSWRLSPSSSGYRTLSLHSTDSVTPSPTGGASPEPLSNSHVVWCVTDLAAVPRGALLIHPQTGRPLTNADGSVYHYDPTNPPVICDAPFAQETKTEQNCEKLRGKLEKQHSFIDNECECQMAESCCNKCCCDCRRHRSEKTQTQQEQKTHTKPASPCKNRYETTENTTNHNTQQETHANHKQPHEPPTNHKPEPHKYDSYSTNQRPVFEASPNQRLESKPAHESPNQREPTNQRPPKVPTQDQDVQYVVHQYQQFRHEEVSSPQVMPNAYQPEVAMQPMQKIAPIAPIPMADPNLRPVSLTNLMYPAPMAQPYPYVNRMEQSLQPMYQQTVIPTHEEKHLQPSQNTGETTFRIDPSYPYAPLEYAAQCGACPAPCPAPCGDPGPLPHQPHRSYSVPYAPEVQTVMPPSYPLHNVILQHHHPHMNPYPYSEQVQWAGMQPMMPVSGAPPPQHKLYLQEVYPLVYPNVYPPYNVVYPQMVPQPYGVCQPCPEQAGLDRTSVSIQQQRVKRPSISGSSRATPLQTPEDKKMYKPVEDVQQASQACPVSQASQPSHGQRLATPHSIMQIKDQMAQLTTRDKDQNCKTNVKNNDFRRRNSGNGLLGNYPTNNYNGRVAHRPVNDETQLSSAARAIVNSIRNMQAKSNYRRPDFTQHRPERPELRRRETDRVRDPRQPTYGFRQMSPGTWSRRSPGPIHPILNPRRPHPDNRNPRR